ncbi:UNVERIFIED_CONTAM: hypothetical protein Slati_1923500 [Sesamum latifolium]|uniref:Uncharacterized protein n=1 Tax=Sesamum latifolium TaxID=2727402 RepID=A0AAW2X756_9LAMI
MSSTDESVRIVGETPGEDPSEATSKRLDSNLPFYTSGRRWSLSQAAHRLLDESSEEEEDDDEEDDGSSPSEVDPDIRESKVPPRTRGSRPSGSKWVSCYLRQSEIHQLVEEFAIPPEGETSKPFWPEPTSCVSRGALEYHCCAYYSFMPSLDIMFSKLLLDEHRAATTPSTTRSSRGTPSSSEKRGKHPTAALPRPSSKRSRPSSSTVPPNGFTRHTSTPPPPHPRDLGSGSLKSPPSLTGDCMTISCCLRRRRVHLPGC